MFGIGTSELMIILAVGLIVIGPQKLPDLAKAIGRAVGEFRKATTEIKETLEGDENLASVKQTFEDAMQEGMTQGLVQETPEEAAASTVLDNPEDFYKSDDEAEPAEETGSEEPDTEPPAEAVTDGESPEIEKTTDPAPQAEPGEDTQELAASETDDNPLPAESHEPDRESDA